jgi:hypothetical protein
MQIITASSSGTLSLTSPPGFCDIGNHHISSRTPANNTEAIIIQA